MSYTIQQAITHVIRRYFDTMPWHAVPFSNKSKIGFSGPVAKLLKVSGIPTVGFFNGEGKLITASGRGAVDAFGSDCLRSFDPEEKKKLDTEAMEKLFSAMDIDGDGFVSPNDIESALGLLKAPSQMIAVEKQTLMTRDADGDGKLNK